MSTIITQSRKENYYKIYYCKKICLYNNETLFIIRVDTNKKMTTNVLQ
jgi:hypothetical protein